MKVTASIQKGKTKDLAKLAKKFKDLHKQYVEIGYFNGEMHDGSDLTLASLATILEYGTNDGRIPARFAFSQIAETNNPSSNRTVKRLITANFKNTQNKDGAKALLDDIGRYYQKEIRKIMGDKGRLLENSPITARLKGGDKPLVDSSELQNNVGYRTSKDKVVVK